MYISTLLRLANYQYIGILCAPIVHTDVLLAYIAQTLCRVVLARLFQSHASDASRRPYAKYVDKWIPHMKSAVISA